jgi:DNA-binding NarL/FixJ family response regulator
LRAEQQRSALGELRMALVLGGPGLGKTRLAAELLPHDNEFAIGLTAHGCLFKGMPPFGPWADALGLHASDPDVDWVCRVCGSGLRGLPPLGYGTDIAHDAASCAEALRYHVVEWIPGLLARASADQPIVMILDDVHRSDAAVWEMLLRLVRENPTSRLFVLTTARPAELATNRTALEVLHALEQDARLSRVQLAPLSRQDIRELTAEIIRQDHVPPALVDWLMAHSLGNPRFAVGLLEALVEQDTDLQAPALGRIPERLARSIRTELAQLDRPTRTLLELLAIVDIPMDPDDLARLTGAPIDDVAVSLERLVLIGMVVERQHEGSLGYALAHPLTWEVLYTDIGGARRRVMHRRVAETLRESGQTEAAAYHYVRAAQTGDGEAVAALIELTRRARQRGLNSTAWRTVSMLGDLLRAGDRRWLAVLDAVFQQANGDIIERPDHYVADIAALQRMQQLLPGVGDLQRQAEVRLWLAGLLAYGAGDIEAGVQECRQALALYQQAGRESATRSAGLELAKIRGWAGDLRGQEVAARELLREAERAGDQRGIAEALGVLGHTLGWQGRFNAAEKMLLHSIEMAPATASSWKSQTLAVLGTLEACRGHLVSARTRCAQAAASSPHHGSAIARCAAFVELLAGNLAMAQVRQAEAHDPADRLCVPVRLAGPMAIAAAERGALTEARRSLRAMTRIKPTNLGILEPLYWWATGAVARAEGQHAAATSALQRAGECYTAMNAFSLMGFVLADLAEVAALLGDPDTAAGAARSAQDSARRTGAPIHQTLHLLVSAWALISRDRHEAAAQAALHALEGFSSRGYVLLAARARVSYATAIRRSDRGAAEEALRKATAAFEACGATVRHQQACSLLGQLESDGRCTARSRREAGSLTRRERQVAELAAAGYTAAQIATQLHIGVRTAETHLARSYPKLGVTCKQQLVHRAAELGFTSRQ